MAIHLIIIDRAGLCSRLEQALHSLYKLFQWLLRTRGSPITFDRMPEHFE